MTFLAAQNEMRSRFVESLALLNYIRQNSPENNTPLDDVQKAMRGLWLISLYAAFERSANAIVEVSLSEIQRNPQPSLNFVPPIHSIIHYSKIQAVKDCGSGSTLDKALSLLNSVFSQDLVSEFDNPLAERMQNVDAGTLRWVSILFGIEDFDISASDLGRLNMLRERRNAVAHGRESASEVGQRYTLTEMNNIYAAADRVITAFLLVMRDYCVNRRYLVAA